MQQQVPLLGWTTQTPPTKPRIQAAINPMYGFDQSVIGMDVFAETYANTGLTIQKGSILIMLCFANFPVRWYKENEQTPLEQSSTSNPSLDPWAPWWPDRKEQINASETILAFSGYRSELNVGMITANKSGVYTCKYPDSNEDYFTTAIKLTVDFSPAPTNKSEEPKILQTSFDVIEAIIFTDISFMFNYFEPIDLECKEYLRTPYGEHIEAPASKTVIPWWPKLKVNWSIERLDKKHQGSYQFIIECQSKNGSLMQQKYQFQLIVRRDVAPDVEQLRYEFRAYLSLGRVYEIGLSLDKPLPAVLSEIELFVQSSLFDKKCAYYQLTNDRAYEECGIIGVSLTGDYPRVSGVTVVLNVTRSCKIAANMLIDGMTSMTGMSSLNIVAIENIFDKSTLNRPIVRVEPPIYTGQLMLTNKTFLLQCMVPSCDWETIQWCKRTEDSFGCDGGWSYSKEGVEQGEGNLTQDSLINVSYHRISSYTESYDLSFSRLQLNHTSWWSCAAERPWFKQRQIGLQVYPTADFYLNITHPITPWFLDGKQFIMLNEKLEKNGQRDLLCKVDGRPKPTISWWRYDNNGIINERNNSDSFKVKEPGDYECKAENGYGENSRKFIVRYYEGVSMLPIAISIPVVALVIFASIGILLWRRRRAKAMLFKELSLLLKHQPPDNMAVDANVPLNDQTDILTYNRNYEIERHLFKLTHLIGQGEFGKVFKGEFKSEESNEERLVAVKVPRDPTNVQHFKDLIAELKIMTFIETHVNVVSLVGACTSDIEHKYQLYILTEFCEYGSLKDYLTKHWQIFESFALNTDAPESAYSSTIDPLLNYAYQAANGMKYLALKNIIHRDLALRNLLLASGQVVKISDFGMSRHHQTGYRKHFSINDLVPIWWMALESIISGQYTQKSDVWSFGVVLWEIFSCESPYAQQGLNCIPTLVAWLNEGRRLAKPRLAPEELYELMLDCWKEDSNERPTFNECKRRIGRNLEQKSPTMYATVQKTLSEAWHNLSSAPQSMNSKSKEDANDRDEQKEPTDIDASAHEIQKPTGYLNNDFNTDVSIDFPVDTNQGYMQPEIEEKNGYIQPEFEEKKEAADYGCPLVTNKKKDVAAANINYMQVQY